MFAKTISLILLHTNDLRYVLSQELFFFKKKEKPTNKENVTKTNI